MIGGVLSTNAGGNNTVRYGNARELMLGLEVVLPDGSIWHGLRRLRKDNTGYALRHVFVGAEGTLGIITAAVLKLFARPRANEVIFAAVRDAVPGAVLMPDGAKPGLPLLELRFADAAAAARADAALRGRDPAVLLGWLVEIALEEVAQ
jgi:FAD/FMN-containing dehydrogenase